MIGRLRVTVAVASFLGLGLAQAVFSFVPQHLFFNYKRSLASFLVPSSDGVVTVAS